MHNGALQPKTPRLSSGSLILAAVVHCLLIGGLWMGVSWQPKPEQEVAAEVWDIKVREAAPLAAGEMAADSGSPDAGTTAENINTENPTDASGAQPEPQARRTSSDAMSRQRSDIALSQERRQVDRQIAGIVRQEQAARQPSPQSSRTSARNLQSLLLAEAGRVAGGRGYGGGRGAGLGGGSSRGIGGGGSAYGLTGTGGTGSNAYATGPARADGAYIRRVAAKIKSNTIYNVSGISGNPAVVYDVDLYPDGSVRSVRKCSSSGTAGFDEAVRQAVYRSAPYPKNSSGRVPSSFVLTHRPKG